jgi:two-component system, chemotaxis family, sensor kinase Cph1
MQDEDEKESSLRQRALHVIKESSQDPDLLQLTSDKLAVTVHELRVHQVELKLQNEELRKAQEDLLLSKNRYWDLYDYSPVGYFSLDKLGRIVDVNIAGAHMLGQDRSKLKTRRFAYFVCPEHLKDFHSFQADVTNTGTKLTRELKLKGPANTSFHALLEAVVARSPDTSAQVNLIIVDINELKTTQELLRESYTALETRVQERTAELSRLNEVLSQEISERKRAQEKLTQSLENLAAINGELRQFAYVVSHDLQEPLRNLVSSVQMLAKKYQGKLDERADKYINFAETSAKRMIDLIQALLAYSRAGTHHREFYLVEGEVIFQEAVQNLQELINQMDATITHDPLPRIKGDSIQLGQVFQNLISNGIRFCKTKPEVHVSAEKNGENWVISFKDNGIGIKEEHWKRIFDIFQRLHTRDEYPGMGVGLSIVKKIIERHHGRIWIESQVGQGTTFRVSLPVNDSE